MANVAQAHKLSRLAKIRLDRGDISEIAYKQHLRAATEMNPANMHERIQSLQNDHPVRITM